MDLLLSKTCHHIRLLDRLHFTRHLAATTMSGTQSKHYVHLSPSAVTKSWRTVAKYCSYELQCGLHLCSCLPFWLEPHCFAFCMVFVVPYSVGSAALQKLSDQRGVQMFAPGSKELLKGLSPIAAPPHAALNSLTTTASTESTVVLHGNTISSRKKKRCQITRTSQLAGDSLPPRALPGLRLPDDAGCREGGQVAIFSWDGDPAHHTTGALRQAEILKILKRFFPRRLPNPPLCLRIHKMDQACLLGKTFYEHLSYHSLAKGIPACCNPALKPIILPHVSVG